MCSQREILLARQAADDHKTTPAVHPAVYDMFLCVSADGDRNMIPDDDLSECMDVYHEYEYDDGLNPALRRQWKTGSLADAIASRTFESSLLDIWHSEQSP